MIPERASDLDRLAAEVERQTAEVRDVLGGLSEAQARWRPSPERWSAAGHIEHLTLINTRYQAALETCLARARARGLESDGPYRHGWMGRWFTGEMEPPPRRRVRTFRGMSPDPDSGAGDVIAGFEKAQRDLADVISRSRGVDLGRARFSSPFFKLLRMSLGTGFTATLAHNRRHIWLAREVMEQPGFPGGAAARGDAP